MAAVDEPAPSRSLNSRGQMGEAKHRLRPWGTGESPNGPQGLFFTLSISFPICQTSQ